MFVCLLLELVIIELVPFVYVV